MTKKKRLDKIRALVKKEANVEDWKYHILLVTKYAKKLAQKLKANEELVEVAALLHDLGRVKYGDDDHELTGAKEAEKILPRLGYDQKFVAGVRHCIESHRSSAGPRPKTLEAKILANADGLCHFDILPLYFYWRSKKNTFDESLDWVEKKYWKSWNKKLTMPEAKKMVVGKYKVIKTILKEMQKIRKEK